MKKTFTMTLLGCIMAINVMNAQTENKYYGAKKGDFAVNIGADPIFKYIGNMFNGSSENTLSGLGNTFSGKYYFSDRFAIEAGMQCDAPIRNSFTYEDETNPEKVTEEDYYSNSDWKVFVGGKYHIRPGKRMQPFVGASILYLYHNTKSNYKAYTINTETISKSSTPINYVCLDINAGIEYFLTQSISINAKFTLQANKVVQKEHSKFGTTSKYHEEYIDKMNYSRLSYKGTYIGTFSSLAFNFYF
jgi:outer membrane protein W